ncbi:MAG: LacI family DNA-binding transcriptional regulator [Anaerolineales bacterium]|nr:LacI family DNA-binding transcriptional regulator [Anaerolineales bacterium]
MKRQRKSVTIYDVAQAAGVSVSTVSRVLNGKADVSEDTLQQVQKVIKELGFVSSLAARGMRSHRTNVLGLIMPDVESLYSFAVLRGVNQAIAQLHYDLIVYTSGDSFHNDSAEKEAYFVSLLNGNVVDGAIVVAPVAANFTTTAPLVIIDPNNLSPECPAVIATNQVGAMQAMQYLTDLGHRRIGFITGRLDLVSANRRLQGYKDGLAAAGIPLDEQLIQIGDYSISSAVAPTRNLLALPDPPTAIFASNDMSAIGVYRAAEEAGLRIPEDLSVIGFDNLHDSVYLNPALTTIDQFISEMGSIAVDMVVQLIKGEALPKHIHKMPTQLVIRKSCRPI